MKVSALAPDFAWILVVVFYKGRRMIMVMFLLFALPLCTAGDQSQASVDYFAANVGGEMEEELERNIL